MRRLIWTMFAGMSLGACMAQEGEDLVELDEEPVAEATHAVTYVYGTSTSPQTFDGTIPLSSEWALNGSASPYTTVETAPSGEKFLGPFVHNDKFRLSLAGPLAAHKSVKVEYKVRLLGNWNGAAASASGADTFSVKVFSSSTATSAAQYGAANYSNTTDQQYVNGIQLVAARTGSVASNSLGYSSATYPQGDSTGTVESNHVEHLDGRRVRRHEPGVGREMGHRRRPGHDRQHARLRDDAAHRGARRL